MEHLVRVCNEKDRRTLEWLRAHAGEAAIAAAAAQCSGPGKPYLSAVCRRLGVVPPVFSAPVFSYSGGQGFSPVAAESMAAIRSILAARVKVPAGAGARF
jgi:hypothetical protein